MPTFALTMERFTKKIQVKNEGLLNFTFNDTLSPIGPRYFVTVTDHNKQIHHFKMQKEIDGWKIVNAAAVPGWIVTVEKELAGAIAGQ